MPPMTSERSRRSSWTRARLAVVLFAVGLGGCFLSEVKEGDYAFRAEEILRDDCALLAEPDALWDGRLRVAGQIVWIDSALFGMELAGQYKSDGSGFLVDGSAANVELPARGGTCTFESLSVGVDAQIDGPTTFGGTFRLRTTAGPDEECTCELWTRFTAQRQGT